MVPGLGPEWGVKMSLSASHGDSESDAGSEGPELQFTSGLVAADTATFEIISHDYSVTESPMCPRVRAVQGTLIRFGFKNSYSEVIVVISARVSESGRRYRNL